MRRKLVFAPLVALSALHCGQSTSDNPVSVGGTSSGGATNAGNGGAAVGGGPAGGSSGLAGVGGAGVGGEAGEGANCPLEPPAGGACTPWGAAPGSSICSYVDVGCSCFARDSEQNQWWCTACFSPEFPDPTLLITPLGCACDLEEPRCIQVDQQLLAMHCIEQRWQLVQDGVCADACTGGTTRGSECTLCAPDDACLAVESRCLSACDTEACPPDRLCVDGLCRRLCG
jgi:hypothetical protein